MYIIYIVKFTLSFLFTCGTLEMFLHSHWSSCGETKARFSFQLVEHTEGFKAYNGRVDESCSVIINGEVLDGNVPRLVTTALGSSTLVWCWCGIVARTLNLKMNLTTRFPTVEK